MWDLPRPGLKPMSPALAGGFLTTAPPGKPNIHLSCSQGESAKSSFSVQEDLLFFTFWMDL